MAAIGFIGLGNMGCPWRATCKAGHQLVGFDVVGAALDAAVSAGARAAGSASAAAAGAEVVLTMLPEGRHPRGLPRRGGIIARADPRPADRLLHDRRRQRAPGQSGGCGAGLEVLDAGLRRRRGRTRRSPSWSAAARPAWRARPILELMGKTVVHTGASGNSRAAKICNNMLLAISMIGVCEAFVLAERLGLPADKLFEVSSRSSGQCWALTGYCPVPGLVPNSPANREYRAGFTAAMMAKDLRLAQNAAQSVDAPTPMGAQARALYALFANRGHGGLDFSAIIRMIAEDL